MTAQTGLAACWGYLNRGRVLENATFGAPVCEGGYVSFDCFEGFLAALHVLFVSVPIGGFRVEAGVVYFLYRRHHTM